MKFVTAAFTFLLLATFAYAAVSSSYTTEDSCRNAGYSWCQRCSGKEISNWGTDKCLDNNLQCIYGCSKTCGGCETSSDCQVNLTDTTCFYDGLCSACSCSYRSASCPQNGTVQYDTTELGVCYYGSRYCTSTGCSVSKCALRAGEICDPVDGCVSCENEQCTSDRYVIDKRCSGSDVLGRQITYACYNNLCNVTRTDNVLIEKCKAGCDSLGEPECNDELCNIAGTLTDCNRYDGFYGDSWCSGNDVYWGYRDYSCGNNECIYTNIETKLDACKECQNGRCYDSGVIVTVNGTSGGAGVSEQASNPPAATAPINQTIAGQRLYNGLLFGSNDIRISSQDRSGQIRFTVTRTNGLGTLTIEQGRQVIFRTRSAGDYTVSFNGDLRMYTTSSGWLFFVPAVHDIGPILVQYD